MIVEIDPSIGELVKECGGYCPCAIEENEDTLCPCKDFREQKSGVCHCGRYEKVERDLTANEYQKAAMRTAREQDFSKDELFLNAVLGLCGESGEVADMVKKARFQGHKLDREHLAKELGDIAWYLSLGAWALGYDLETVLQMNIDKLMKRYPDGFKIERSLHRKEDDV